MAEVKRKSIKGSLLTSLDGNNELDVLTSINLFFQKLSSLSGENRYMEIAQYVHTIWCAATLYDGNAIAKIQTNIKSQMYAITLSNEANKRISAVYAAMNNNDIPKACNRKTFSKGIDLYKMNYQPDNRCERCFVDDCLKNPFNPVYVSRNKAFLARNFKKERSIEFNFSLSRENVNIVSLLSVIMELDLINHWMTSVSFAERRRTSSNNSYRRHIHFGIKSPFQWVLSSRDVFINMELINNLKNPNPEERSLVIIAESDHDDAALLAMLKESNTGTLLPSSFIKKALNGPPGCKPGYKRLDVSRLVIDIKPNADGSVQVVGTLCANPYLWVPEWAIRSFAKHFLGQMADAVFDLADAVDDEIAGVKSRPISKVAERLARRISDSDIYKDISNSMKSI